MLSGAIPCRRYVKKAVERHLKDLKEGRFEFDWDKATRALQFIEKMPHTKGEWAFRKERLKLEPWQIFADASMYGWINPDDGYRRFNEGWVFVPRKNGKSAWTAAKGLYMLTSDGEYGAEVYAMATSEKQAIEVFLPSWLMAKRTKPLVDKYGIELSGSVKNPTGIYLANGSKFERLIGDPPDGSMPHFFIIDEYHEHRDDRGYDTGITGMGARSQPMLYGITTAGFSIDSPAYTKQVELESMLDGDYQMDTVFALLHGMDDEDDWKDVETAKKANPNYGVSVKEKFIHSQLEKAYQSPAKADVYKAKHLNKWVQSKNAFFDADKFRLRERRPFDMSVFKGGCEVSFDLSDRRDMTAWSAGILIDDVFYTRTWFYLPEVALELVPEHLKKRYEQWRDMGYLTIAGGQSVDYGVMLKDFYNFMISYGVNKCSYDSKQSPFLNAALSDMRVKHGFYPGGGKGFSVPMRNLEIRIHEASVVTDGNPVLNWQCGNVIPSRVGAENIFPMKKSYNAKIDGMVTTLSVLGMALGIDIKEQQTTTSISYDFID